MLNVAIFCHNVKKNPLIFFHQLMAPVVRISSPIPTLVSNEWAAKIKLFMMEEKGRNKVGF